MLDNLNILIFILLEAAVVTLVVSIVLVIIMICITTFTKDKRWYTKLVKKINEGDL